MSRPTLGTVAGQVPGWFARAACLGHPNLDWWFPEADRAAEAAAIAVCGRCPVVEPCAAYAASEGFVTGVFGGRNMASKNARRAA